VVTPVTDQVSMVVAAPIVVRAPTSSVPAAVVAAMAIPTALTIMMIAHSAHDLAIVLFARSALILSAVIVAHPALVVAVRLGHGERSGEK
jgi:hypothetical protein